ncbi:hypothetical protein AMTR_s00157p00034610 [Amborella trichopoda]|uniref:Uncharacterized protein n=1 Tax=Amborella trichopoda TaxID=13333 RepID=W1PIN1_AMBTC|nr:hypothetical protein AMTR_s00157p00034610 [Amborella trichopoda]
MLLTKGRPLQEKDCSTSITIQSKENIVRPQRLDREEVEYNKGIDDAVQKNTDPGRSPGVGHNNKQG